MRVPLLALLVAPLLAQSIPEIRGTAVEVGSRKPVAAAKVILMEFLRAADNSFIEDKQVLSAITDAYGDFVLRPDHFGEFRVGVEQAGFGYEERPVVLSSASLKATLSIEMLRGAGLVGRVVDVAGRPLSNQSILLEGGEPFFASTGDLVTNSEGIVSAENLLPMAVRIHVKPFSFDEGKDLIEFTEEAFSIVDEDIENLYWPGGVADPALVLPVNLRGGETTDLGTITVRRAKYYRVRLTLNRDCKPGEYWSFRVFPENGSRQRLANPHQAKCRKDFLLKGVAPGEYQLAILSGTDQWAVVPFVVSKENTSANVTFTNNSTVSGNVTAAGNENLSKLGQVQITMRPTDYSRLSFADVPVKVDRDGTFAFRPIPWKSQRLLVEPATHDTFVKEIRYNGVQVHDLTIDVIGDGKLDIVLDSQAGALTANCKSGDGPCKKDGSWCVLLVSTSLATVPDILWQSPPFVLQSAEARIDRPAAISSIPPGDYRLIVLRDEERVTNPAEMATRLARAQKITFGRGEQKSIELEVK
ncbi:MAG: hypothetical protein ABIR70_15160 [Bryobacteraceae bacterium]